MREENPNAMQYRKSTHLAGVDLLEKNLTLTIKKCIYATDLNVNGKVQACYEIQFEEDVKPMVVNSTNRKTISKILQSKGMSKVDSIATINWVGMQVELYFEPNRSFAGEKTGGIGIVEKLIEVKPLDVTDALVTLNKSTTLAELKTMWGLLTTTEQANSVVLAKKDELKSKLK